MGIALLGGMAVSGGAAVGLERLAYRPLRKRNAPSLVFLITAIGASFVLQEFVHYVLPNLTDGKLGGVNAQVPIRLVAPQEQFTIFGASVTNITLIILIAAFVLAFATDIFVNRTKFGRGIRAVAQDPTTATLMGVTRERVIILTFLIGGLLAGAAALLYTLRVPNGIIYSGGFILGHQGVLCRGAGRHRQPARRAARWPDPRGDGELRPGAVRHRLARRRRLRPADPDPDVPADRHSRRDPGEGEGMSNPAFDDRPKGGVGDSFRGWWNAQSRPAQWAFGVPFILLIALLPLLNIPLLTTEGTNFGAVMAQFGMYALIAIGLNVVVGQSRPARPRLRRVLRGRRLHGRPADQPEQSVEPDRPRRLAVHRLGLAGAACRLPWRSPPSPG